MMSLILLALTPLPPELDHPPDWLTDLVFAGEFEVVVLFTTDKTGEVTRVAVRTHKRRVEVPVAGWERGLLAELKKARGDVKNPDSLRVVADDKWRWRHVEGVSKACKDAGFLEVGFMPWPKR